MEGIRGRGWTGIGDGWGNGDRRAAGNRGSRLRRVLRYIGLHLDISGAPFHLRKFSSLTQMLVLSGMMINNET